LLFAGKSASIGGVLLTVAAAVLLSAPPSQGVTFRLLKPTASKATAAQIDAVVRAMRKELEGQGYGVVTTADQKASGTLSGSVEAQAEGVLVKISIAREKDQLILEEVSELAKPPSELEKTATLVAKQLATAWRMANGVRVKIK
jgi:hypothetical protein